MKVENILQSKGTAVFAVPASTPVKDAVALLAEKNIGAVVVSGAGGSVAGIFSERDVVRRLKSEGADALSRTVGDCMTPDPITCTMATTVDELMSCMTQKRIRHVPVVEQGRLLGIVSIGDVVKRKIEEAEREAAALRQYIAS